MKLLIFWYIVYLKFHEPLKNSEFIRVQNYLEVVQSKETYFQRIQRDEVVMLKVILKNQYHLCVTTKFVAVLLEINISSDDMPICKKSMILSVTTKFHEMFGENTNENNLMKILINLRTLISVLFL